MHRMGLWDTLLEYLGHGGRDWVGLFSSGPATFPPLGTGFASWWMKSTSPSNLSTSWFMQRLQESWNLASPWTILSTSREEKFFLCLKVCISYLYWAPLLCVQRERISRTQNRERTTGIWPRNDLVTWCASCSRVRWEQVALITSWSWPSIFLPVPRATMWGEEVVLMFKYQ